MSGHSKWSTIKHKKALNDAKKGKIFSRLSVQITIAARQGGGDPNMNPNLRLLLDQAKAEGFPSDNVKKAIDKGTGEGGTEQYHEASYEGVGPGGIQLIVDVLTSNTNRTVADIRNIFSSVGGKMGETGSVSWNFDVVGYISMMPGKMVKSAKFGADDDYVPGNKEEIELQLMDIQGVNDIQEGEDGSLDIVTDFKELGHVRDEIYKLGYVVKKAQVAKIAKMRKTLSGESFEKALNAIETLEDYDDVQNVWTDLEN